MAHFLELFFHLNEFLFDVCILGGFSLCGFGEFGFLSGIIHAGEHDADKEVQDNHGSREDEAHKEDAGEDGMGG